MTRVTYTILRVGAGCRSAGSCSITLALITRNNFQIRIGPTSRQLLINTLYAYSRVWMTAWIHTYEPSLACIAFRNAECVLLSIIRQYTNKILQRVVYLLCWYHQNSSSSTRVCIRYAYQLPLFIRHDFSFYSGIYSSGGKFVGFVTLARVDHKLFTLAGVDSG